MSSTYDRRRGMGSRFLRSVAGLAGASLGLVAATGWGQLTLELKVAQSELLQYEKAMVRLTIKNDSKTPLVAARDVKELPELEFKFHRESGKDTRRLSAASLLRDVYIIPGNTEKMEFDLARWYDLQVMGQYLVSADVEWKGMVYHSNQVVVEIVRGIEIPNVAKTVMGKDGKTLKLSIRYWRRDRVEHCFLVVDAQDGQVCYGVFDLGTLIRVSPPVIEADEGNITVKHQSSAVVRTISKFKIGADGVTFVDQQSIGPNAAARAVE